MEPKSTEEIRKVVEEINEWHKRYEHPEQWIVDDITHFYLMPVECYLVLYQDGYQTVFTRDDDGILKPTTGWTYFSSDHFEQR